MRTIVYWMVGTISAVVDDLPFYNVFSINVLFYANDCSFSDIIQPAQRIIENRTTKLINTRAIIGKPPFLPVRVFGKGQLVKAIN